MVAANSQSRPLFPVGEVVATPSVLAALAKAGESPAVYLRRHVGGDFGVCNREDWQANERAIREGARVLSAYVTGAGQRIWVITESDRSSTCLLLPEEY